MRLLSNWNAIPVVLTTLLSTQEASAFEPVTGDGDAEVFCLFNTVAEVPMYCVDGGEAQDFEGAAGALEVNAGDGDDTIILYDGVCSCVCSGVGAFHVFSMEEDVFINGEGDSDILIGANDAADDMLWDGGPGDDFISTGNSGAGGEDILGGDDNDTITKYGAGGPFSLHAGDGSDIVGLTSDEGNFCAAGIGCDLGVGDVDGTDCGPLCDNEEGFGGAEPVCGTP